MRGTDLVLDTPSGELAAFLPLPGVYNVYNALGAAACALELGASLDDVRTGIEGVTAVFGRTERVRLAERELAILLVKNPAGANEVLRTLLLEEGELDLWIALNDRIADGRDVSWVWDADFELLAGRVRRVTCSGTRAEEMALRLKYAGVSAEPVIERDLARSLDLASADGGGAPLYALPTYTALLELRERVDRPRRRRAVVGVSAPTTGFPDAAAWHDVECAAYDADLRALARARAETRAGRCSSSAAAPVGWPSTWPPTGTR